MVYTALSGAFGNLNVNELDSLISECDTSKKTPINLTGVICTIGPASSTEETLTEMVRSGMRIARLNFSHGDHASHRHTIDMLKALRTKLRRPFAIALDTKGPEIRTGTIDPSASSGTVSIARDSTVTFTNDVALSGKCCASRIYCDYAALDKLGVGNFIYVEDGLMQFRVTEKVDAHSVRCVALNGGELGSKKGVNLPNVKVELPAMTEQDKRDLKLGVEEGVDMIFASFIRSAEHCRQMRQYLHDCGDKEDSIYIIPKIENHEGLDNFREILAEVQGIMAARGDMGIETMLETVPLKQKMLARLCNEAGKPFIVATQMLESMCKNPRATRAEVYDVAGAVLDGASCVMLSGESAKGAYPINAVRTQARVAAAVEHTLPMLERSGCCTAASMPPVHPAEVLARRCGAKLIVCAEFFANATEAALSMRNCMPNVPVVYVAADDRTLHQTNLYRGMLPCKVAAPPNCPSSSSSSSGAASDASWRDTAMKDVVRQALDAYKSYTGGAAEVAAEDRIVLVAACPRSYNISVVTAGLKEWESKN